MCERVTLPGGISAIVCGGHRRRRKCHYCSAPGTIECDAVLEGGRKTCDRLCCRAHAKPVGENKDLCRDCAIEDSKNPLRRRLAL